MTRRSDAIALALSGSMHAAAIWAVLAVIAHDRLPALPFVIDLSEVVTEAAQQVMPPPPAPAPPALARPAIRPAASARRIEPPRRAEPMVPTPAVPPAVPPVSAPAAPATTAEATLVAPEPIASPRVSTPPAATSPAEGQGGGEARSTGRVTAAAEVPTGASTDVAKRAAPSVAALPPAPAAPMPVTRPARPRGGYQVQPAYPAEARRANAEGTTLLRVHVSTDGLIDEVLIERSAGHAALDRAAAEAIRRWRFEPARNATGTVAVWVVVPVNFQFRPE